MNGHESRPVFCEPWEAQALALVVALQDRGVFTTTEWAQALSRSVHAPGAADDGSDYYEHLVTALQGLLEEKGIVSAGAVDTLSLAWQRAAHATPHGQAIALDNDPHRRQSSASAK